MFYTGINENLVKNLYEYFENHESTSVIISAEANVSDSKYESSPEVTLYLSKKNEGKHNLYITYTVEDNLEINRLCIFDKNFTDAKEAIEAFFLKIKQTEDLFEIKLKG